jgi:hypothetical protein
MGIIVKKNTAVAVMEEVTEGTYVAPSSASKYVQTLADGFELSPSKEVIERDIFTSSIGKTSPRTGQFQVTGSIPVELRAFSTEGGAPEFDLLMKSALGTRRQATTTTTTKASGNTASVLQIEDADITKFNVGDIIMIKMDDAYHVSPITAKSTGTGTATITLLIPHPSGDIDDSVVIGKFTTYTVADSGHPSLSISKYLESAVLEQATGCRVSSMSLEGFSTGQLPTLNFGFEGLNFDRSLTAIPHTPSYDTALPPIILDAKAYMDTDALEINELTISLENTLGFKSSISEANGRSSGRATERTISGTFNPYKEDDSIANFTKYVNDTPFKLFAYAKVPTGTDGEFGNVVAVYMPNCVITEMGESDQDGLVQENISFSANRGSAGTTNEIYICFI